VSRTGLTVDSGVIRRQPARAGQVMRHQARAHHVSHATARRALAGHGWPLVLRHFFDRFSCSSRCGDGAGVANSAAESYFSVTQNVSFARQRDRMAFFFALATREVVEAVMPGGALHSWRRWGLRLSRRQAASSVRSSISPTCTFPTRRPVEGWPVACAIDVAAAYYVLKTILPRSGALPFALLIGIGTDSFGVFVVAPPPSGDRDSCRRRDARAECHCAGRPAA